MHNSLNTPSQIFITIFLFAIGAIYILKPVIGIKILVIWPRFLSRTLGIKFMSKGEDIIKLFDEDLSSFKEKYKNLFQMMQLTGAVSLFIAFASLCALLSPLN